MKDSAGCKLETVVFQVTTQCPYQCPQCYMERGDRQMPLDFAKEMIAYAKSNGAEAVQLTGGEPILYDHLIEVIAFAKAEGMYSFMATSGFGATPSLYSGLRQAGLTVLCVSINDIVETENAKSRMSYTESLSAIRIAVDCGLCCFANVVVTDGNVARLELLGEHLTRMGVQGINLLRPVPSFDGNYIPQISSLTISQLSRIVRKKPKLFFVENCFGEFWRYEKNTDFICEDIGKSTFFVNADCTVSLCSKRTQIRFASPEEMRKFTDYPSIQCTLPIG